MDAQHPSSASPPSVPRHVSDELTQILANLVLGDNEIRSKCVFSKTHTRLLTAS